VLLLGGGLSLVATRQLWAVAGDGQLHVGGLCNRNLAAFAQELPLLLQRVVVSEDHESPQSIKPS
jgi:cytochrome c biogenesis protein